MIYTQILAKKIHVALRDLVQEYKVAVTHKIYRHINWTRKCTNLTN